MKYLIIISSLFLVSCQMGQSQNDPSFNNRKMEMKEDAQKANQRVPSSINSNDNILTIDAEKSSLKIVCENSGLISGLKVALQDAEPVSKITRSNKSSGAFSHYFLKNEDGKFYKLEVNSIKNCFTITTGLK